MEIFSNFHSFDTLFSGIIEKELEKKSVIRKFRITATDKKSYSVQYYNLDVIISVGYRVKSFEGTKFRIWASKILKKYLINGYVLNQQKLLEHKTKLNDLQKTINFIQNKSNHPELQEQTSELKSELYTPFSLL